jgi:hypothetical protein
MSVERAARIKIGRPGSVRARDQGVVETVIEDLSTSGCFVRGDLPVAVGSLIAIGVPGIGTHAAKVMRLTAEGAGCAFLLPLGEAEVQAVRTAEALPPAAGEVAVPRANGFVQIKDNVRSAAKAAHDDPGPAKPRSLLARALGGIRAHR